MKSSDRKIANAVTEAARQVESTAGEYFDVEKGYERFAEEGKHYLDEVTKYVKKNPTTALLGALALGAVVAFMMRRRDQ